VDTEYDTPHQPKSSVKHAHGDAVFSGIPCGTMSIMEAWAVKSSRRRSDCGSACGTARTPSSSWADLRRLVTARARTVSGSFSLNSAQTWVDSMLCNRPKRADVAGAQLSWSEPAWYAAPDSVVGCDGEWMARVPVARGARGCMSLDLSGRDVWLCSGPAVPSIAENERKRRR
jgi:hypothetical protein